jgi:uncharacterized membrane protein
MVLLAGCAKPVPSEQPGTSAPTEDSVQVPTSGSATLPAQTEPVPEDMTQIPRQNTLRSGNPQTLSDWVFTNYEQTFSWRDSVNNFCSVSITLPALAPVTDFAIRFNEEIWELGSAYVEEAVQCRKQETSNILSRVTYEAYLHDEILSIVLIENTVFDYTAYRSWSFDLEDRQALSTANLADELLDLDYPEFILASNAVTAHHFKEQYGSQLMILALSMVLVLYIIMMLLTERKELGKLAKNGWYNPPISGLANGANNLLVMVLRPMMSAAVLFPMISGGGLVITFLISLFIFKEKLGKLQVIGFFLGLGSVILLSL